MKTLLLFLLFALISGCATNPVLSGKPQHWKGKPAAEMMTALGAPNQIIPQSGGSEVWIYRKSGEFIAPAEENTSFRMSGASAGNFFGAGGGINTVKEQARRAEYENVWRFLIRDGEVKKWYAERMVDGRVVWEDH